MKILLVVSSSGGHITPGVALAERIRQEMPEAQIVWAYQRTKTAERFFKGISGRKIGIRKVSLPFGISWRWLGLPGELAALAFDAWRLVARERPDLVIGFGFEYFDIAENVARDFPQVVFYTGGENKIPKQPNVVAVTYRLEEACYLLGVLAGRMSTSEKAGCVGPY